MPHVDGRPETDELRQRTLAKCLYALAIAAGRRAGVYRELEAEALACRMWAWAPTPAGRELRLSRPCVARQSRAVGGRTQPRPPGGPMATNTLEQTGRPQLLATYTADVGERILVGQRVDGVVRVNDVPADGVGRCYLVEAEVGSMAELEALVADYTQKAQKLGWVPMHGW
jgi:hypothetical protein